MDELNPITFKSLRSQACELILDLNGFLDFQKEEASRDVSDELQKAIYYAREAWRHIRDAQINSAL